MGSESGGHCDGVELRKENLGSGHKSWPSTCFQDM
jgi:hypothetical protein